MVPAPTTPTAQPSMLTTSSREKPLLGSKRGSRARPLSITTRTPGRVTDASGAVVTDVGTYDRPATLGEHTLSWPTVSGGSSR